MHYLCSFSRSWCTLAATDASALITFLVYTLAVFGLAALSSRLLKSRSFLSEYFLGSRSLGVWALALTFAATMASGGSFTGFPSLIYTHGWVLALLVSSYMIFPLCTMGFLGKRINQVARRTGAITVPDILRDRFDSRQFGLLATSLIVFFMCVNLIGQFKAGSMILQTLLQDVEMYQTAQSGTASIIRSISLLDGIDPGYLLCLLTFGVAVIIYTTWGGFHAVVWTDVMQGVVMVLGVLIMLPLALSQVGGLENATRQLAKMVPPQQAILQIEQSSDDDVLPKGSWLKFAGEPERVFRLKTAIDFGKPLTEEEQKFIAEHKIQLLENARAVDAIEIVDDYDLKHVYSAEDGVEFTQQFAIVDVVKSEPAASPGDSKTPGSFVTAPGPHPSEEAGLLPLSLAFSFFFMWAISGTGQPHSMVRLMAFRNTKTLRMSIVTVVVYYSLIYFPLVIIFCCARLLLPGMEFDSDRIMPQVAVTLTNNVGAGWLAGILIAAPFAAVMSTVDSFLLMIASSIVRDIYQRNVNPNATEKQLKRLSYLCTLTVGVVVVLAAMNPPKFLQYIIIYVGSGLAAAFLAPVALGLYWPRTTTKGAMCSMLVGFLSHLSLYLIGWITGGDFSKPYRPLGLDPVVVGIVSSFIAGFVVSLLDTPPDQSLVQRYFYRRRTGS